MLPLFAIGVAAAVALIGCNSDKEDLECRESNAKLSKDREVYEPQFSDKALAFPVSDSNPPDLFIRSQASGEVRKIPLQPSSLTWKINRNVCPESFYTEFPLQSMEESNGETLYDGRPGINAGTSIRFITPISREGETLLVGCGRFADVESTKIVDTKNEITYDWSLSKAKEQIKKELENRYGVSWGPDDWLKVDQILTVGEKRIWVPYRRDVSKAGIAEFNLDEPDRISILFDQDVPGLFNNSFFKTTVSFEGENRVIVQYYRSVGDLMPTHYTLIKTGKASVIGWTDSTLVVSRHYGEVSDKDDTVFLSTFINQKISTLPPLSVDNNEILVVSQTIYNPLDIPDPELTEFGKMTLNVFSPGRHRSMEFGRTSGNPVMEKSFLVGDPKVLCLIVAEKGTAPEKKKYQISTFDIGTLTLNGAVTLEQDNQKGFFVRDDGEAIVFDDVVLEFDFQTKSYHKKIREEKLVDLQPSYAKYASCQSLYGETNFEDNNLVSGEAQRGQRFQFTQEVSTLFRGMQVFLDDRRGLLLLDHSSKVEAFWTPLPKPPEFGPFHPLNRSCYMHYTFGADDTRLSCKEETNKLPYASAIHSKGKQSTIVFHNDLLTVSRP